MSPEQTIADRAVDVVATAGVLVPAVATIAEFNLYLQAGAYVFGMISACAATYYYLKKANTK